MVTVVLIFLGIISAVLVRLPYLFLPYMIAYGGDTATIGLMAIDASLGRFHTFFYGQGFTGPIEVYIIAPLVKLFGPSNIAFFSGSMIIFGIFLISTYLLAKEFKGKRAGLYALFYCVVPPLYFYQHNISLHGYHVTILILGNIIFLMTLKISKNSGNFFRYVIFGLAAGLGLWNHFAVFFYIIPAVLFLILRVRFIRLVKGGIAGVVPFFLGSMPFWIYNLRYGFRSLNIYDGHPCVWLPVEAAWWQVLKRYLTFHVFGVLGVELNHLYGWILLILYVICLTNLLILRENRKNGLLFVFYIMAILFISVKNKYFIWFVGDYRPALVFLSVIPLAVSVTADRLSRWHKAYGAFFILIFICINGWQIINDFPENKMKMLNKYGRYKDLIQFFKEHKISGFMGDFITTQDINFITKKEIVGAELFNGRSPTDLEVDNRDKIALVNCHDLKENICRLCQKHKEEISVSEFNVIYDIIPYPYYGKALDRSRWSTRSNYPTNPTEYAIDGNLQSYWSTGKDKIKGLYFEIDLGAIHRIYKLEAINIKPHYCSTVYGHKIKVSLDRINWKEVTSFDEQPLPMFLSGPRIYLDIACGRWQEIFEPVRARFLRITQLECGFNEWMINELFVYEYLGQKNFRLEDYIKDAEDVYAFLSDHGVRFVYADYWLSAKIRFWSGDRISTLRKFNECWPGREDTSRLMRMDENSAIVVSSENDGIVDDVLESFNINNIEKKIIGRYICYLFKNINECEKYFLAKQECMYWMGPAAGKLGFRQASRLLTDCSRGLGQSHIDEKKECLVKAVKIFPRNITARKKLAQYSRKEQMIIERKFTPRVKTDIEFENGVKFRGYTIERVRKRWRVSYFWELSRDLNEEIITFIHFIKGGKIIFQNDHQLLEQYGLGIKALPEELLVERYWITEKPQPGVYEIVLGLCIPYKGGERLKIKGTGFYADTKVTIGEMEIRIEKE